MMAANGLAISLVLMLILANEASSVLEGNASAEMVPVTETSAEMVPVTETTTVMMPEMRRKLGSFQICALCTCCGGARGMCLPSPCCYAINCNIPNKPFGFCSFTPKTCNCFRCQL